MRYAQLDVGWISHVFIYEWIFTQMFDARCCCNWKVFYDWRECVMSILAPRKNKNKNKNMPSAILLTLGNKAVLDCIVQLTNLPAVSRGPGCKQHRCTSPPLCLSCLRLAQPALAEACWLLGAPERLALPRKLAGRGWSGRMGSWPGAGGPARGSERQNARCLQA